MKTKKKKSTLKRDKQMLDFTQIEKAKDIIDKSIIDGCYKLEMSEYN